MDAIPQTLMEEVRNGGVDIAGNHEAKGNAQGVGNEVNGTEIQHHDHQAVSDCFD